MIISVVTAVVLIAVLAGGYVVVGNSTASARIATANAAIAGVQKIDFADMLANLRGGFDLKSSAFNAMGFQSGVTKFVESITADATTMSDDSTKLDAARRQLNGSAWLTALNRGPLDDASGRIDQAQTAISDGKTITSDMALDGDFYTAYAAAVVDFANYATAVGANNITGMATAIEQAKADFTKTLPLASAPGLPTGVHEFVSDFSALVNDGDALLNAALTGNKTAYDAANAQGAKDGNALDAIDTSSFDSAIETFYQPLITQYGQELQQANG